jgi:hypothetical protein
MLNLHEVQDMLFLVLFYPTQQKIGHKKAVTHACQFHGHGCSVTLMPGQGLLSCNDLSLS